MLYFVAILALAAVALAAMAYHQAHALNSRLTIYFEGLARTLSSISSEANGAIEAAHVAQDLCKARDEEVRFLRALVDRPALAVSRAPEPGPRPLGQQTPEFVRGPGRYGRRILEPEVNPALSPIQIMTDINGNAS